MKFPFRVEGWGTPNVSIRSAFGRRRSTPAAAVQAGAYNILYTRGDDLITPPAYRGAFENALTRNLLNVSDVPDEAVSRAYAVAMTAYACTEYRANVTGSLPLEVLNGVSGADETPLTGTPLDYFLSRAPRLLADLTRSHLIFGRTYLRKRFNARGLPTGLEWLNPLDVYEYTERNVVTGYRWTDANGAQVPLQLSEVVYAQAFDARSQGNGLSKFEAAWLALNIDASLATFAAAFFVNGAQPDGFLSFTEPLTEDEFKEAKAEWKASFRGAKNAHKTAVMPGGATWQPITGALKDLAMPELKQAEREDICAVFEVDPILVHLKGAADPLSASSTYSAVEIGHLRNVALPFARGTILAALNDQWAMTDFGAPYRLDIDEQQIPALVEAQFVRADTAGKLSDAHVLDYDESRALLGYAPRERYLVRKPDEALSLWTAGAASLNDVHQMVIGAQPLGLNGDVVVVGGVLLPVSRLMEVANANVEKLKAPPANPFGGPPLPPGGAGVAVTNPPAPQLPSGGGSTALPGTTQAGSGPLLQPRADARALFAGLFFQAGDPALLGLQNRLRELYPDVTQWTPPDEFHATLFFAPDVTDFQAAQFSAALASIPLPEDLSLTVGSLHSFDNLAEHALVFYLRRNADLLDYQQSIYEAAQAVGILASPYSAPDAYLPHVTMGYAPNKISATTYTGKLDVRPVALRLSLGDTVVLERPLIVAQAQRARGVPLQLAVDLGGNPFVRYARRILSDALTARGIHAEWVGEDAWRLVLAQADRWTPSALATLIRSSDYAGASKVDVRLDRFLELDGVLYGNVAGQTAALENSACLDMQSSGLRAIVREATEAEGIRLGVLDAPLPEGFSFPPVDFPLVLATVAAYAGDERYHSWALRSASAGELKELVNWERVVTRKGRAHEFRAEVLPRAVRDYVQVVLAEDVPVDEAFAEARALLTEPRSYADTEAAFTAEIAQYFQDAVSSDIGRQAFAAKFRSALRRAGLMAFRDGMESEGYSPESFSAGELAAFRAWQDEVSARVTDVGTEIYKGAGLSDAQAAQRPDMWANASLRQVFYQGAVLAAADKSKTWKRNPQKDSCDDCVSRDGQTMTYAEWAKIGLPGAFSLKCHGVFCGCSLEDA